MFPQPTKKEIGGILKRRTNDTIVCGYTLDDILKLPPEAQAWIVQYFREATGSISSHNQRKILTKEQLREAWREQKKRLLRVKLETSISTEQFDQLAATDSLNPETILIILQSA